MLRALLLLAPLGLLSLSSEYLWRKKVLRGEGGRKLVHILAGVWISFWPFFVSYRTIIALAGFLIVTLVVSKTFKIFHAVHDVKRRTYGEIFFPLTILVCAYLQPPAWIFTLAILYLALSDGLAAVTGTRYKKIARVYRVFDQQKSVLGTGVYFLSALLCSFLVRRFLAADNGLSFSDYNSVLVLTAVAATGLENLLPYGTDNFVIPVFVILMLT